MFKRYNNAHNIVNPILWDLDSNMDVDNFITFTKIYNHIKILKSASAANSEKGVKLTYF